jgi:flagellar protein FliL
MKKPLLVMLAMILAIIVVVGGGLGTYMYFTHSHHKSSAKAKPAVLTPSQALALQVTLPQMTANLNSSGLIQFTLTLQTDSKATKTEVTEMQNQIQDKVNDVMREFTPDQLRNNQGVSMLKQSLLTNINGMLQTGKLTNVYLSQVLVQ